MNPSASLQPPQDRRETNRRSGTDRRAPPGSWLTNEPPAEHVRNAMQLLVAALGSDAPLTSDDFARLAERALSRLSLALNELEGRSR